MSDQRADRPVDSATLDRAREVADAPADAAVAAYFANVQTDDPGALFGHLVRHVALPVEDQVPEIAALLAEAHDVPA